MLAKHEHSELHGLMSHHGSGDGDGLLATIGQHCGRVVLSLFTWYEFILDH